MRYRAYYATSGCRVPPLEKDRWPRREFGDLDQALAWAEHVATKGTAVLAIDGDDGTQLTMSEIAAAISAASRAVKPSRKDASIA